MKFAINFYRPAFGSLIIWGNPTFFLRLIFKIQTLPLSNIFFYVYHGIEKNYYKLVLFRNPEVVNKK